MLLSKSKGVDKDTTVPKINPLGAILGRENYSLMI